MYASIAIHATTVKITALLTSSEPTTGVTMLSPGSTPYFFSKADLIVVNCSLSKDAFVVA